MTIFRADKLYFDELGKGISIGLNQDNGFTYDADAGSLITGVVTVDLLQQKYYAKEILDLVITSIFAEDENYSKYVDLMELVHLYELEQLLQLEKIHLVLMNQVFLLLEI